MIKGAVKYRDTWLAPGSRSLELYEDREFKELDQHLKTQAASADALVRFAPGK